MKWANVYPTVEMIKQKVNRRVKKVLTKKELKMKKKILSAAFAVAIMARHPYKKTLINSNEEYCITHCF